MSTKPPGAFPESDGASVQPVPQDPQDPFVDTSPTNHDARSNPSKGKFVELSSPSSTILRHPLSSQHPDLGSGPAPADDEPPEQVNLEQRIAQGSSLFGTRDDNALFELTRHRASMAGYIVPSYTLPGDEFRAALLNPNPAADARLEYDSLWLQVQLFWDAMVRTQPNPVSASPAELAAAVDLMADVAAGRLVADAWPDYDPRLALRNVRELRRRLQRLELAVRTAVTTCGRPPKLHCGCVSALKRCRDKTGLWSRLFGPKEQQGPEDRHFSVRDVACLLRLEDFLTHVSRDSERQLGRYPEPESLVMTAVMFMDEAIKEFLDSDNIRSILELKLAWVKVLCNVEFRAAIVLEVQTMVSDGIAFSKKHGHADHREGCDQRVDKTGGFIRRFSRPGVSADPARPASRSSPLLSIFKKA
ncbi:hypothetical protein AK830_g6967 [Neonectria ditissima]|uniref:Uncharacterized protein n=1 Tax=Neonectria ditissima TaxID=78410 RepID=A0A0P7BB91_9HYPO|nr:hypothetical protein AK830_g6967 [Neonectria ditissima]